MILYVNERVMADERLLQTIYVVGLHEHISPLLF